MLVIVPDVLANAINAALDKAYETCPEAAVDREQHYNFLLSYYNDHGKIPEFSLAKNPDA